MYNEQSLVAQGWTMIDGIATEAWSYEVASMDCTVRLLNRSCRYK